MICQPPLSTGRLSAAITIAMSRKSFPARSADSGVSAVVRDETYLDGERDVFRDSPRHAGLCGV